MSKTRKIAFGTINGNDRNNNSSYYDWARRTQDATASRNLAYWYSS